jgi:hypothetical protein
MKKILKDTIKNMTPKQRKEVILFALSENRKDFTGLYHCDCEHLTLVCLQHGTVMGSEYGRSPKRDKPYYDQD